MVDDGRPDRSGKVGMHTPATAVFVHGGWHDGWSRHLVRELLGGRGAPSIAPDPPMTTLDQDAAALRAVLDELECPAIVVAHFWGGSVAALGVSGSANAKHLVYVTAVAGEAGHPVGAGEQHPSATRAEKEGP